MIWFGGHRLCSCQLMVDLGWIDGCLYLTGCWMAVTECCTVHVQLFCAEDFSEKSEDFMSVTHRRIA